MCHCLEWVHWKKNKTKKRWGALFGAAREKLNWSVSASGYAGSCYILESTCSYILESACLTIGITLCSGNLYCTLQSWLSRATHTAPASAGSEQTTENPESHGKSTRLSPLMLKKHSTCYSHSEAKTETSPRADTQQ